MTQQHHIVHPITEALRHRRIARNLSQSHIADMAGVSRNSVHNREEVKFPALTALDRWARALGYQLVLIDVDHK